MPKISAMHEFARQVKCDDSRLFCPYPIKAARDWSFGYRFFAWDRGLRFSLYGASFKDTDKITFFEWLSLHEQFVKWVSSENVLPVPPTLPVANQPKARIFIDSEIKRDLRSVPPSLSVDLDALRPGPKMGGATYHALINHGISKDRAREIAENFLKVCDADSDRKAKYDSDLANYQSNLLRYQHSGDETLKKNWYLAKIWSVLTMWYAKQSEFPGPYPHLCLSFSESDFEFLRTLQAIVPDILALYLPDKAKRDNREELLKTIDFLLSPSMVEGSNPTTDVELDLFYGPRFVFERDDYFEYTGIEPAKNISCFHLCDEFGGNPVSLFTKHANVTQSVTLAEFRAFLFEAFTDKVYEETESFLRDEAIDTPDLFWLEGAGENTPDPNAIEVLWKISDALEFAKASLSKENYREFAWRAHGITNRYFRSRYGDREEGHYLCLSESVNKSYFFLELLSLFGDGSSTLGLYLPSYGDVTNLLEPLPGVEAASSAFVFTEFIKGGYPGLERKATLMAEDLIENNTQSGELATLLRETELKLKKPSRTLTYPSRFSFFKAWSWARSQVSAPPLLTNDVKETQARLLIGFTLLENPRQILPSYPTYGECIGESFGSYNPDTVPRDFSLAIELLRQLNLAVNDADGKGTDLTRRVSEAALYYLFGQYAYLDAPEVSWEELRLRFTGLPSEEPTSVSELSLCIAEEFAKRKDDALLVGTYRYYTSTLRATPAHMPYIELKLAIQEAYSVYGTYSPGDIQPEILMFGENHDEWQVLATDVATYLQYTKGLLEKLTYLPPTMRVGLRPKTGGAAMSSAAKKLKTGVFKGIATAMDAAEVAAKPFGIAGSAIGSAGATAIGAIGTGLRATKSTVSGIPSAIQSAFAAFKSPLSSLSSLPSATQIAQRIQNSALAKYSKARNMNSFVKADFTGPGDAQLAEEYLGALQFIEFARARHAAFVAEYKSHLYLVCSPAVRERVAFILAYRGRRRE